MERSSEEGSPARNSTPAVLNSTEQSEAMARETITISSITSLEPQIVTIDSDFNKPTISYRFGSQRPTVPPSLNDFNLPPNAFNVLATMAVIPADEEYSLQSPELSILSTFLTRILNVSTIEGWEATHTTTDDATFFPRMSPDESIGIILPTKFLTPISQDMYLSLRALPPNRRLHDNKRGN